MISKFKDYFSQQSDDYIVYRPRYPDELFSYLSSISNNHEIAWDCATGSGQSAVGLSKYYESVIATDASKNQIENATKVDGVTYKVEKSEESSIEDNSIDLITVAQALHWFNVDTFYTEVDRVLKNKGILAVWSYGLLNINTEIDKTVHDLYCTTLGPYWPPERKIVEEGYKNIVIPMKELKPPTINMECEWDLSQLVGYLCTWSAVKKYETIKSVNPVGEIYHELSRYWGESDNKILVRWPLTLKLWIKTT